MNDPGKAIFLSYAHEDAAAARRIAEALRAAGLEVWFDTEELRGGDEWDAHIRQRIRECVLFIPVVSAQTQARAEGYFRREWKLADHRTEDMGRRRAFLMPVCIDDTKEADADVPDSFLRVQWSRLPGALPTPQFVAQTKRLLETPAAPAPRAEATTNAVARKPFSPVAIALILGVVAVGAGVVFFVTTRDKRELAGPPPAGPAATPASRTVSPKALAKGDKSVAVLPFTNMSDEKENAFFTDGVHEDVLTNLALIRELRVVSRTTVQSYRGTTKPMKQIAQELGVTYILEGSVRRSGNKVRVTGQLIHAASDEHVWAQTYDRDLTDIFSIQSELSREIAGALKAALSPEEQASIVRRPTENTAAYDLFLQARDILNREGITIDAFKRRTRLLEDAVALDPAFARAWGDLGAVYANAVFNNFEGIDANLAKAKAAIERAVALQPDDPEVISSLGSYYYYGYRDYARATELYDRRARLQPNSAPVFNSLALIQRRQGRWLQSVTSSQRAVELDPANLSYLRNLSGTLLAGGRYAEGRVVLQRLVALQPGRIQEAYALALVSFFAGGETREVDEFFLGLTPEQRDSPLGLSLRKSWARTRGDSAEAIRIDQLQPYYDGIGEPHWQQAVYAAFDRFALGDRPGAISRLGAFPAETRERLVREPQNAASWAFLAAMEIVLGNREEALRCIGRSIELLPESRDALEGTNLAVYRAYCYAWLGDKEKAIAEFRRLLLVPGGANVYLLRYSRFPIAGDPAFQALLNDPKNNAPLF